MGPDRPSDAAPSGGPPHACGARFVQHREVVLAKARTSTNRAPKPPSTPFRPPCRPQPDRRGPGSRPRGRVRDDSEERWRRPAPQAIRPGATRTAAGTTARRGHGRRRLCAFVPLCFDKNPAARTGRGVRCRACAGAPTRPLRPSTASGPGCRWSSRRSRRPTLRPSQPASTYFTRSGHGRYFESASPS